MEFMKNIKNVTNKAIDLATSPKVLYEKSCNDFTCISLTKPLIQKEIKAKIIDKDNHIIEISGSLSQFISIPKPYVLTNSSGDTISLEPNSDISTEVVLKGKEKDFTYDVTQCKFSYVRLDSTKI